MTTLQEAIKVVEEIENDELAATTSGPDTMDAPSVDVPPPSEPPVDDTAIGADTEGNVVLQLLGDIKELLAQLVAAENPEPSLPPEGEGEGEGEIPVDALPEPPEEGEDDDEGEEGEDDDEEDEEPKGPTPPQD